MSNITRLIWDDTHRYDIGVDRGVFYPKNSPGVVWNGLLSVKVDIPSNSNSYYIDGQKKVRRSNSGSASGTIEAYSYPEIFYDNQLTPSRRSTFGLSYRTMAQQKYKIHILYNVLVPPPSFDNTQDSGKTFAWDFATFPVKVLGAKASSHLIIDASTAYESTVAQVEDILYGSDSNDSYLPMPDEILSVFEANSVLVVIDNGDGTFTINGPDSAIQFIDASTFQVDWPSVVYLDAATYRINSQ